MNSSMNAKHRRVVASAPSSTANLGPGFDVFGLALDAFHDRVELEVVQTRSIQIEVHGEYGSTIPLQTEANSAGLVITKMLEDYRSGIGLKIKVQKGVPAGFGLGSSAASASAAAIAFDSLFGLGLDKSSLVKYAAVGEIATAGSMHYDNVSASFFGGFVIVRTEPLNIVRIEPPKDLTLCLAIPTMEVPKKKTEVARSVLPDKVPLKQVVSNIANACTMVAGFMLKDTDMIGKAVKDVIIEPARAHLIPSYDEVRKKSLDAGALAVTISGAGPSVIAFMKDGKQSSERICKAMEEGFRVANLACKTVHCKASNGAELLESN
ncbi:MAG: homoserine kinase [Nitrososphaerales archaeon]